jgi:hypothetical protein
METKESSTSAYSLYLKENNTVRLLEGITLSSELKWTLPIVRFEELSQMTLIGLFLILRGCFPCEALSLVFVRLSDRSRLLQKSVFVCLEQ